MDYQILKDEIINDPLGIGYGVATDEEVANFINTTNRSINRASMSGSEIFKATDSAQYGALTDAQKDTWLSFCGISEHDPFGVSAQFVIDLFGLGSATVVALQALRVETVSRGVELGIGNVRVGDVAHARSL